jgi:hypothetical protein
MPNPGMIKIFHCTPGVASINATIDKSVAFQAIRRHAGIWLRRTTTLVSIDQDFFIEDVSSMTPAMASASPSA